MLVWLLGKLPDLWVGILSLENRVHFDAFWCTLRGVGGQKAGSYLGFLVPTWPLVGQPGLWSGILSPRHGVQFKAVGCVLRACRGRHLTSGS